jgi:hypothetical protein
MEIINGRGRVGVRTPINLNNPLWANLVSGWKFDNDLNDVLGVANGTFFNGAGFATGKVGDAASFDGVDDYVFLGNNLHDTLHQGDWSLSLWMYKTNTAQGALYSTIYVGPNTKSYGTLLGGTTSYSFQIYANSQSQMLLNFGTLATNQWNHLIVTRSSSLGNYKSYLNGTLVSTVSSAVNPNYFSGYVNRVTQGGRQFLAMGQLLNGKIDETYIWNKVLSEAEVAELYNSSNGKQYPN